jgi:predicted DNA repair protein MutK
MSGGLLALLDDVVALTKIAAATLDDAAGQAVKVGSKAAGVVIDDAAVTPRYVTGLAAQRELPIIGRIALGSIKNKILFLLPAALLLSVFLPQAITPLLMLGGLYLAYEGFEKLLHMVTGHSDTHAVIATEAPVDAKVLEDQKVTGAIRTDFILSAEIMAIALANITAPDLTTKAIVLASVALLITAAVYGAVALIVKADDFGVALARRGGLISGPIGRALVRGMPPFLQALTVVGTIAMLWVGGGILVHGLQEYGVTGPEHVIHDLAEAVRSAIPVASDVFAWATGALGAALVGIVAGAVTALLVKIVSAPFAKAKTSNP